MNYPLISEYKESILSAQDNLKRLTNLRPVKDDKGNLVMCSGNYSVVFKMKDSKTGKLYAVKCFIKDQENRAERYKQIIKYLNKIKSSYFVETKFYDKEIFVDSKITTEEEFPVVLMEWIDGKSISNYINDNLSDNYALSLLSYEFCQLTEWLLKQPFAHGDIKSDNVIIRDDRSLVLVDYDGMFIPTFSGQIASEIGSPDFRHPLRSQNQFDSHIDDFTLVLILLCLKVISVNPQLFIEFGGLNRLLFSESDLRNLSNSTVMSRILSMILDKEVLDIYTLFVKLYSQQFIIEPKNINTLISIDDSFKFKRAQELDDFEHYNKAKVFWKELESVNYKPAIIELAIKYFKGIEGFDTDYSIAYKYASSEALSGNHRAMCMLGLIYRDGKGVAEDVEKSIIYFQKAIENGNRHALWHLGKLYLTGTKVEKNVDKGLDYMIKAAEAGLTKAQSLLADLYKKGKFVSQNNEKYLEWLEKAADNNEYDIPIYKYALEIYSGKLIPKDEKKAFKYFLKAAELGHPSAQFYVGYFYKNGIGTSKNIQEAIAWYTESASNGNASSQNNLAICYENGDGVKKDLYKAFELYSESAEGGDIVAQNNLATCFKYGTGTSVDIEKEIEWRKKAAANGYYDAQITLADNYNKGYGVSKNIDEEEYWLWYASKSNKGEALYKLSQVYKRIADEMFENLRYDIVAEADKNKDFYLSESLQYLTKAADSHYLPALVALERFEEISLVKADYKNEKIEKDSDGFEYTESNAILIGHDAWSRFSNPIEQYSIKEGTYIIADSAFYDNNILKVIIPSSVVKIGKNPFAFCSTLNTIINKSSSFIVHDSALFTNDKKRLICYFGNHDRFSIPEGVIEIDDDAFAGSDVEQVDIPESVVTIGTGAFARCHSLKKIQIPDSVKVIGSDVFNSCGELHTIIWPKHLTYIPDNTFCHCISLVNVSLSQSLQTIGKNAFAYCKKLNNIIIPEAVREIGDFAFWGCTSLKDLLLPGNIIHLGMNPFIEVCKVSCSVGNRLFTDGEFLYHQNNGISIVTHYGSNAVVRIPNFVSRIGDYAFYSDKANCISLGNSVKEIGIESFSSCNNLSEIWLNDGLETIKEFAFDGCSKIKKIVLPDSIKSIEKGAFKGCNSITDIYYSGIFEVLSYDAFTEYVSYNSYNSYKGTHYGPDHTLSGSTIGELVGFRNLPEIRLHIDLDTPCKLDGNSILNHKVRIIRTNDK